MGGIAAALYAIGYCGKEIEDIVYSVNWVQVFNDKPPSRIDPKSLKNNMMLSMV
jgi:predicted acylesterase/phospholipase RssA